MREESKTIVFALGVCLICSILLSGLAAGLKSIQTANQEFDVKRNIVKAFGIDISTLTRDKLKIPIKYTSKKRLSRLHRVRCQSTCGKNLLEQPLQNMPSPYPEKVCGV